MRALAEAVREAEWGTWWEDLPGGSTWLEAAAAAIGVDAQLGGNAHTTIVCCDATRAVEPVDHVGVDNSDGSSCGDACDESDVGIVEGRQAADGGCAGVV